MAWLVYFLIMIALVGGVFAYLLATPLLYLGRWYRPAREGGEIILQKGISLLMRLEPWLNAETDLRPHPGALCVSNHRSHLDSFLLLSRIPGVRILAKDTLFRIPFLGFMMRGMRQIPVRRGDIGSYWQAMETIRIALRENESVHVFPEMTRCEPGAPGIGPFQLAPFHVAFQEKRPVVPIVFRGTDDVWPKGQAAIRFRRRVTARTLPELNPADFDSAESLAKAARAQIATSLEGPRC
jgi:1-acyl-sn-glycerol-3-phosphate acyltransferase